MSVAVLPDAEDYLRVRRLRIENMNSVVEDEQAVVDVAAAGIRLHDNSTGEVRAIAYAVSRNLKRLVADELVGAKAEVDADVLDRYGRSGGGIEIGGNADDVVGDGGVVGVRSSRRRTCRCRDRNRGSAGSRSSIPERRRRDATPSKTRKASRVERG